MASVLKRQGSVENAECGPRSQGLSSSRPIELYGTGRRETLGTRLNVENFNFVMKLTNNLIPLYPHRKRGK